MSWSATAVRWTERLARLMAVLGGLILMALIVLVVMSVAGRALNGLGHTDLVERWVPGFGRWLLGTGVGPLDGDFEVLEAGVAVAIFACLPLCQFVGGHATVDLFTDRLPSRLQRALIAFWESVLAAVIVLIGLRLYAGLLGKLDNGETTFLLQFPVWWAYAASLAACATAMLTGVVCALLRWVELIGERDALPIDGQGAR